METTRFEVITSPTRAPGYALRAVGKRPSWSPTGIHGWFRFKRDAEARASELNAAEIAHDERLSRIAEIADMTDRNDHCEAVIALCELAGHADALASARRAMTLRDEAGELTPEAAECRRSAYTRALSHFRCRWPQEYDLLYQAF